MRHRISGKKLNRTSAHRRAMQRNLAQSLFEHGQVQTTLAKAKDIRPFVERLITLAGKALAGSRTARQQIHKLLSDRSMIPAEHRESYEAMSDAKRAATLRSPSGRRYRRSTPKGRLAFTGESVAHRLIHTIAPRYADRAGGYTRLIRLAKPRVGDHGPRAIIQLVGEEESPGAVAKPDKTARRRRADARYGLAVRLGRWSPKGQRESAPAPEAPKAASDGQEEPQGEADNESEA